MLFRLITTWVFNLIDAMATVYFYTVYEGTELNPISAAMLNKSPALFIAFKLIVMTTAVGFIWWRRDLKLYRAASWVLFVEYLLVVFYYLCVCIYIFTYFN